jgi:hypothetical protein
MKTAQKIFIPLFSLSLIHFYAVCFAAEPKSADYRILDATSFGVKLKVAQIEVDLGEEVFIGQSNNCPTYNCAFQSVVEHPECICNYATHDSCGIVPAYCNVTCLLSFLCFSDWIEAP